jgi:hypothetical protein
MKSLISFLALLQVSSVIVSVYSHPASTSHAKPSTRRGLEATATKTITGKRGSQSGGQGPRQRTKKEALLTLVDPPPHTSAKDLYKQARTLQLGAGEEAIHSDDHHRIVKHMVQSTKDQLHQHYKEEIAKHQAVTEALRVLHGETYHRAEHLKEQLANVNGKGNGAGKGSHVLDMSFNNLDDSQGSHFAANRHDQATDLLSQRRQHQPVSSHHDTLHHDHSFGVDAYDPLYDDTSLLSLLQQPSHHPHAEVSHQQLSPSSHTVHPWHGHSHTHGIAGHPDVNPHHLTSMEASKFYSPSPSGIVNAVYHPNTHHDVAYNDPHIRAFHNYDPVMMPSAGTDYHHDTNPQQDGQHRPASHPWPGHLSAESHLRDQNGWRGDDHIGTIHDWQHPEPPLLAHDMQNNQLHGGHGEHLGQHIGSPVHDQSPWETMILNSMTTSSYS